MTLRELVEKCDGEVSFVVGRLIAGGVEDIVEFSCDDCEAIKDNILDSTVSKYSISTSTTTRVMAINVVLDEATEESSDSTTDDGSTTEP